METSGSLSKSMTLTATASYRGRNSSRWRNANSSMKWFQFCDLRCCRWWWATTWRRSSCTAWSTGELTLDICLLSRKSPSSGRSRTPTRTWTGRLVSRSSRASSASWAGRSPRRWWCKCDHWSSNRGGSSRSWHRYWILISRRKLFSKFIICNVRWPLLIPT